jgi:predicted RNA binding protein YcfA (HicA-like mRNA interferase family)
VSGARKIIDKLLEGRSDQNISFDDLCYVLDRAGFSFRQGGGSHRIYSKQDIPEIINVQPKGNLAKAYQVKQVRELLVRYKIEVQ